MPKFGVAGYPPAFADSKYAKNRMAIFEWLNEIGLDAFEAQMTYGPRTKKENCAEIRRLSEEFSIRVSIHASYFIVFTSDDAKKIQQSHDTLLKTYELADIMGAKEIVLHPGPLYGELPEAPMNRVIDNLGDFFESLGVTDIGLYLETAGKRGQLGSTKEIVEITDQFEYCHPCIDFGHVHARTGGTLGGPAEIDKYFESIESLGIFEPGKKIHFHYTPIEYGPKGEITHKALSDKLPESSQMDMFSVGRSRTDNIYHPRFQRVVENLMKYDLEYTVISECYNSQEEGALAMKGHLAKVNSLHNV